MIFLEDPRPALVIGVVALAALAFALTKVERRRWLILLGMGGVLLLTVAGVVVERVVVTEREQISDVLDQIAASLEHNDLDGVLAHVSPTAQGTRSRAKSALATVEITSAGMSGLEVTLNRLTSPPTAEARFNGTIRFNSRIGYLGRDFYAARFLVELQQENNRWLVTDHLEYTSLRP